MIRHPEPHEPRGSLDSTHGGKIGSNPWKWEKPDDDHPIGTSEILPPIPSTLVLTLEGWGSLWLAGFLGFPQRRERTDDNSEIVDQDK